MSEEKLKIDSKKSRQALAEWIIYGLIGIIPILGWNLYGLFDLDEGYYAAVVSEMNRRGNWIVPYYNGHPWFEKPILLYWIAKPCIAIFGIWIGPRLPSVLATIGTYGLIAWFGNRRLGQHGGYCSLLALSTSLLFLIIGRMMLVDPLLVFTLTACFLFFWESLVGDKKFRLLSAICLGLSVLAKGPVGCVFFVAVAIYTFVREPQLRPKFKGYWLQSILAFVAVVSSWYVPAFIESGDLFVQKFLIEQNVDRFKGGDNAHSVPMPLGIIYYIPVLLIGMGPWLWFALQSWRKDLLRAPKTEGTENNLMDGPLQRYLWAWALSVFILFTISGSKLPHYILPALPPLALLAAFTMIRKKKILNTQKFLAVSLLYFIFFLIGFPYYYKISGQEDVQRLAIYMKNHESAGDQVIEYQMSRIITPDNVTVKDKMPSSLKINETSLPSLNLYLNQNTLDIDDFKSLDEFLMKTQSASWLITRSDRLSAEQVALLSLNFSITVVEPKISGPAYVGYKIEPKPRFVQN